MFNTIRPTRFSLLAAAALWAMSPGAAGAEPAAGPALPRFTQDRFAIGFWVDPPADERMEERYREIADANFTLVVGGFGATTTPAIRRQLDLSAQLGLRALVAVPGKSYEQLAPDHPALWGYLWRDEPSAAEFADLAASVQKIRELRPGRLAFINLFPNYAPDWALKTSSYAEYVRRFVDEVKPDVLCMDHYPQFDPGPPADSRQSYLDCLAVLRAEALRAGIPFWNFFNTMPFGPHTDPTEGQIRWQIYASLAHGAKGVLWFCYYTPAGHEFPKGGAIIRRDGTRTRHYEHARRINGELKRLDPTLMKLTSTGVARVARGSETTAPLAGGAVVRVSGSPSVDLLIGEFRHEDGRRAVLLQNHDFAYTSWPTVTFDVPPERVVEVDKSTGREVPVRDDSPDMDGLQLSLDAGDGRLFLLPGEREAVKAR